MLNEDWKQKKEEEPKTIKHEDSLNQDTSNLISGFGPINEDFQRQAFLRWLLHTNSRREEHKGQQCVKQCNNPNVYQPQRWVKTLKGRFWSLIIWSKSWSAKWIQGLFIKYKTQNKVGLPQYSELKSSNLSLIRNMLKYEEQTHMKKIKLYLGAHIITVPVRTDLVQDERQSCIALTLPTEFYIYNNGVPKVKITRVHWDFQHWCGNIYSPSTKLEGSFKEAPVCK